MGYSPEGTDRLKPSVRAATTADVADLAAMAPDTVDGVSLALGDRILVLNQASTDENGIYRVTVVGTGSDGTWVRDDDANQDAEVRSGDLVYVREGTQAALFNLTTTDPIVVGTTGQTWEAVGGLGGSGTANHIAFFTASEVLASESGGELYWDSGNDRLGIGTSSPGHDLHVSRSVATAGGVEGFVENTGTGYSTLESVTAGTTQGAFIIARNNDGGAFVQTVARGTTAAGTSFGISRASATQITSSGASSLVIGTVDATPVYLGQNDVERQSFLATETVFNDTGASIDFRVEGDTDANLLFVDASTDRVGVGGTPSTQFHIGNGTTPAAALFNSNDRFLMSMDGSDPFRLAVLRATDVGPDNAANIRSIRARGTLAVPTTVTDGDRMLGLLGAGYDGTTTEQTAAITFEVEGAVSTGVVPGAIRFETSATDGSSRTEKMKITSTTLVVNDEGGDFDVRIEGDTDANLLFVDASTDRVGIGTATPDMLLQVAGDVHIDGDLTVDGTTTTVDSETVLIADNHLYLNNGYTADAAQTGGLVVNYDPTTTTDTVNGAYVAGVAATSNPTVGTTGAATYSAGDIIQISGANDNDGLYEVLSHAANTLTIRGVGTTATVEDFTQDQFTAGSSDGAAITQINVSVLRVGTDGLWEIGNGSTTPVSFSDIGTGSGNVSNTGTPVDNQLAVWTAATVIEGDANLTWNGSELAVVAGTIPTTDNALNVTGTLSDTTAVESGAFVAITGAGTGATGADFAFRADLLPGYTGSGTSAGRALVGVNTAVGTATLVFGAGAGNHGTYGLSSPTTAGTNVGVFGEGINGDRNYGGAFRSTVDKASAENFGVAGVARNDGASGVAIGGYFGFIDGGNNEPLATTSAALVADNQDVAAAIFLAYDDGSEVFRIDDGGALTQTSGGGTWEGAHVFNEAGADVDFRIEGDTESNLFFVDASTDRIGIGTAVPDSPLTVTQAGPATIRARTFSDTATDAGNLGLHHTGGTEGVPTATQDGWRLGSVQFIGYNGTSDQGAGQILAFADGTWSGSNFGTTMSFRTVATGNTGAAVERIGIQGTEVVFNEDGENFDLRIEGDTEPNLFFVDASTDTVNIREVNPEVAHPLQVADEAGNTGLGLTVASNTATHHPVLSMEHYRGTLGAPTANSVDDWLGKVRFLGYTNQRGAAAEIAGYADTGWGATGADTPGYLVLATSADGSSTPTERMRIDSVGNVGIGTAGTPGARLDVQGGAIQQQAHAAFAGSDNVQTTDGVQTTDATETTLTSLTLADDTVYWLEAMVIGRDTSGTDRAFYIRTTLAYRQSAGAATLGSIQTIATDETDSAWDCTFDTSTNDVRVRVTGAAATTINWVCTLRYQAVSGNT